jgi:hypothetical protein
MTRDRALNTMASEADAVWAPIHALIALKDLDVSAYVAELVPLFDVDNEWFGEELPDILGKAGQPALEPPRQYIQNNTCWQYGRWNAGTAVEQVGQQHPELPEQAIEILSYALEHAVDNDPETNGFFLADLLHLNAVEALPIIRSAFEQDDRRVDRRRLGRGAQSTRAKGRSERPSVPANACMQERQKG